MLCQNWLQFGYSCGSPLESDVHVRVEEFLSIKVGHVVTFHQAWMVR